MITFSSYDRLFRKHDGCKKVQRNACAASDARGSYCASASILFPIRILSSDDPYPYTDAVLLSPVRALSPVSSLLALSGLQYMYGPHCPSTSISRETITSVELASSPENCARPSHHVFVRHHNVRNRKLNPTHKEESVQTSSHHGTKRAAPLLWRETRGGRLRGC